MGGSSGGAVQVASMFNQQRMEAASIAQMNMQTENAIQSGWTNVANAKINDSASAAKAIRY